MINIRDLKLDDAKSLLAHDSESLALTQDDSMSDTAYLQHMLDSLCALSLKDPLTGLPNRRHFSNTLHRELDLLSRSGESSLLLMIDIDHFKKINDTHGHPIGDRVLQEVAQCLGTCVRPMDTVTRYGGEEFAVILPKCPPEYGQVVAERLRAAIAKMCISVTDSSNINVTVSIGGAYAPKLIRISIDMWTTLADTQLYRAKEEGRNRVFIDRQYDGSVSADEKSLVCLPFTPLDESNESDASSTNDTNNNNNNNNNNNTNDSSGT